MKLDGSQQDSKRINWISSDSFESETNQILSLFILSYGNGKALKEPVSMMNT